MASRSWAAVRCCVASEAGAHRQHLAQAGVGFDAGLLAIGQEVAQNRRTFSAVIAEDCAFGQPTPDCVWASNTRRCPCIHAATILNRHRCLAWIVHAASNQSWLGAMPWPRHGLWTVSSIASALWHDCPHLTNDRAVSPDSDFLGVGQTLLK